MSLFKYNRVAYKRHNLYQQKWERWNIKRYQIKLRVDWDYLNFDREILSNIISIEVDGYHGEFLDEYTTVPFIHEENLWTVNGLFEQLDFYPDVKYDNVYGFPRKLGNAGHWIIEVIEFVVLEYEENQTFGELFEDFVDDMKWMWRNIKRDLQWYHLAFKSIVSRQRQSIVLRDFLMTGSFGGIELGLSHQNVSEILAVSLNADDTLRLGTLEVGLKYGEVYWFKYNCNKFEDKPYPPTIRVVGFLPQYEDTTIDEFIFYLESENIPYEIVWKELMNIHYPVVHINDATKANFAEDTLAIMGIYPKEI